jgi:hypothetical protein
VPPPMPDGAWSSVLVTVSLTSRRGRFPNLGAAGQGFGDEPAGGGDLVGLSQGTLPLHGRRDSVIRWHWSS